MPTRRWSAGALGEGEEHLLQVLGIGEGGGHPGPLAELGERPLARHLPANWNSAAQSIEFACSLIVCVPITPPSFPTNRLIPLKSLKMLPELDVASTALFTESTSPLNVISDTS